MNLVQDVCVDNMSRYHQLTYLRRALAELQPGEFLVASNSHNTPYTELVGQREKHRYKPLNVHNSTVIYCLPQRVFESKSYAELQVGEMTYLPPAQTYGQLRTGKPADCSIFKHNNRYAAVRRPHHVQNPR